MRWGRPFTEFPQDARVFIEVTDDQFMRTASTGEADGSEPQVLFLDPAGTVEGRVIIADSGKPAANVRVQGALLAKRLAVAGAACTVQPRSPTPMERYSHGPDARGTGSLVSLQPPLSSQYVAGTSAMVTLARRAADQSSGSDTCDGRSADGKGHTGGWLGGAECEVLILTRDNNALSISSQVTTGAGWNLHRAGCAR